MPKCSAPPTSILAVSVAPAARSVSLRWAKQVGILRGELMAELAMSLCLPVGREPETTTTPVIDRIASDEMFWVDAPTMCARIPIVAGRGIMALMVNGEPIRDRTNRELVCESVGEHHLFSDTDASVSLMPRSDACENTVATRDRRGHKKIMHFFASSHEEML